MTPPKLALRFFRWYCHPKLRDHIEGDLLESYNQWIKKYSKRKADLKFIADVFLLFRPGIVRPVKNYQRSTHYAMLKNYFKIGWRNLSGKRLETFIKGFGLSLGICACTIIYLIVTFEFSFDRFHPDNRKIYRVVASVTESTGETLQFGRVPLPLEESIQREISSIPLSASVIPYRAKVKVKSQADSVTEFESLVPGSRYTSTIIATENFFKLFPREWLAGEGLAALTHPGSVVLTESRARLYFGNLSPGQYIGKSLVYDDSLTLKVTGVVKDWQHNSDLLFSDFISRSTLLEGFLQRRIITNSWREQDMASWTFIKLTNENDPVVVNGQLNAIVKRHGDPETKLSLHLQPLTDIHFDSSLIENPIRTAHLPTLYTLAGIALFIMLLAIANFIVLSVAQSIKRAREVGVRKVFGGSRASLLMQFLIEVLLVTILSTIIAALTIEPILTLFSSFLPPGLTFNLLDSSFIFFAFATAIIVTLLSGLYPGIALSSVLPAFSLKGMIGNRVEGKWSLKKGLIVFQFVVSILFIVASIVIADQLRYVRTKDLGFHAEAIITLEGPKGENLSRLKTFIQELKKNSVVENASLQWLSPMVDNPRGMRVKFRQADAKDVAVAQVVGDENYISLYKISLIAGRNLEPSDTVKEVIVNQNLCKLMGFQKPGDVIGEKVYWNGKPYPIVGVAQDFHTKSLHDPISPLCIINRPDREFNIAIKLSVKNQRADWMSDKIEGIQKNWNQFFPGAPFRFAFYDETLTLLYEKDRQAAILIDSATTVAVLISVVGLFGLALFTTESRAKEMGIRKVLGASSLNIMILIGGEFSWLIAIALTIASPISFYIMNIWLQGFTYHVNVQWWSFILAGTITMLIACATISHLVLRIGSASPVISLRSE